MSDAALALMNEIRQDRPEFSVIHDVKVMSEDFIAATAGTRKSLPRTVIVKAKEKKGKRGKKGKKKKKWSNYHNKIIPILNDDKEINILKN